MLLHHLSNLFPTHGSHTLSVPPLTISVCDWFYITYYFFPAPQIWLEMLSLANRVSWPSYLLQEGPSRSLSCGSCSEEEGKEGQISSASFSQSLPGCPYECFLSIFFCRGGACLQKVFMGSELLMSNVFFVSWIWMVWVTRGAPQSWCPQDRPHWIPQLPVPDIQLCLPCMICKMRVSINISTLSFQKCSGGLGVVQTVILLAGHVGGPDSGPVPAQACHSEPPALCCLVALSPQRPCGAACYQQDYTGTVLWLSPDLATLFFFKTEIWSLQL